MYRRPNSIARSPWRSELHCVTVTSLLCWLVLVMKDPAMTVTGQTYERDEVEDWFNMGNNTDPKTNQQLDSNKLIPNTLIASTQSKN